jgi:6-phosphogluconolactonase (cycloisomerase 2 family)
MSRTSRRRHTARLSIAAGAAATAAATFAFAPAASAAEPTSSSSPQSQQSQHFGGQPAVFVQTNSPTGNAVLTYTRGNDGLLRQAGRYATGGLGGGEAGAVVDPLASQGSLTYDAKHNLLFAVNAGSNTLSEFSVDGARLNLIAKVPTNGVLPTSVTVARDLVYVLDAGNAGAITGFRIDDSGRLDPIAGSTRSLGLSNPANPNFLMAPSQVSLTPDAHEIVVGTKTNGVLDVFTVGHDGTPASAPVVTTSPAGSVPFGLSYDSLGRLLVTEASGGESSYWVQRDAELTPISSHVVNGQAATCWSVVAKGYLYDANAGSNTITGYAEDWRGQLTLLNPSGVTATTDAGSVDLAASGDGQYLYQEATAAGAIDEFKVNNDGSLTRIGAVTGLPPVVAGLGIEGIAAS